MAKTKGSKEKQKNVNELNILNSKTERKMRKHNDQQQEESLVEWDKRQTRSQTKKIRLKSTSIVLSEENKEKDSLKITAEENKNNTALKTNLCYIQNLNFQQK